MFTASTLQQFGLLYTSPGKAGFITALYIILVPFAGVFIGRRPGIKLAFAAIGALIGLYFLCFTGDSFTLELGDLLIFLCAIVFTAHILVIDRFSPKVDGVKMSCIQFFVCAALSFLPMIIFEEPSFSSIYAAKIPILYAGVMSCGVAYTLQIVGQKGVNPTLASLILSLESCFALLGELLTTVFSQRRNTDTDNFTVVLRHDTKRRVDDGLFDDAEHALVPWLDSDAACVWSRY